MRGEEEDRVHSGKYGGRKEIETARSKHGFFFSLLSFSTISVRSERQFAFSSSGEGGRWEGKEILRSAMLSRRNKRGGGEGRRRSNIVGALAPPSILLRDRKIPS